MLFAKEHGFLEPMAEILFPRIFLRQYADDHGNLDEAAQITTTRADLVYVHGCMLPTQNLMLLSQESPILPLVDGWGVGR